MKKLMKVGGWIFPPLRLRAVGIHTGVYFSRDDLTAWLTRCAEAADGVGAAEAPILRQIRDNLQTTVQLEP